MTSKEERKRARHERRQECRRQARAYCRLSLEQAFSKLAQKICKQPWTICISMFLLNGLLGLGMLNLPAKKLLNNNIEALYVPRNNPTENMAEELLKLFPDTSGHDFYPHQQVKQPLFGEVLLWRHDKGNILNGSTYDEIEHIVKYVKNITTFTVNDGYAQYGDLCALRNDKCVVEGEDIAEQIKSNSNGELHLDKLTKNDSFYIDNVLSNLAKYTVKDSVVTTAMYLKVRFHLRQDSDTMTKNSKLWQDHFITYMKRFIRKQYPKSLHIVFRHAGSFYEELGNDTFMDIPYFSFVFTVFLTYLGIVMSGGNVISKRVHIGRIGIVVTPISVLGAWGLLMAFSIEFTNTVGVIPLIIQCHQIINAMITLSHLSDVNHVQDADKRVAYAVSKSAVPVTMTTLVHVITFVVGLGSQYYVLKLVSVYFVMTMLFNYFNHLVFFTACLAIHEHRVDAELHFCCWNTLTPREKLQDEGRHCCVICCCSGKRPQTREDTESSTERAARKVMSRYVLTTPVKVVVAMIFVIYLGFTIWGLSQYDFDSVQVNKVLPKSYFSNWDEYWSKGFKNESVVQFIAIHPEGFVQNRTILSDFKNSITSKPFLRPETLHSWHEMYMNTATGNTGDEAELVRSLKSRFLPEHPEFKYDVVIDKVKPRIIASRFYLKTNDLPSTKYMISIKKHLADLMDDINDYVEQRVDDDDDTEVYPFNWKVTDGKHFMAHSPDFRATDLYMLPLWEILKLAAAQFGMLIFVFLVFNPDLIMLVHVCVWYFSMVCGIFGLSHFAGIYLTPVPMIVYMAATCYSVEVIGHTCYFFIETPGTDRPARMNTVLSTISQALFHTIFGQFLGLLVMIVDESYVFVTVFLIFIIATGLAVMHTIFVLPVALALFGSGGTNLPSDSLDSYRPDLSVIAGSSLALSDMSNSTNGFPQNGTANGRSRNRGPSTVLGAENNGYQV